MPLVLSLLKPRWWAFVNPLTRRGGRTRSHWGKYCVLGVLGLVFWGAVLAVSLRVLTYFQSIEEIGDLLAFKLLSIVLAALFSLLIFSGILTNLSKLFLSRDLPLVHATPVPGYQIYLARWIESMVDGSWMVLVYSIPVFIAYGVVFDAAFGFYVVSLIGLSALVVIASAFSVIVVQLAVMILPASRLKSIFIFLGLALFLVLYLAFRLSRPERLVDPEAFATALVYLKALHAPSAVWLPSSWVYESIQAALTSNWTEVWLPLVMSISFAVFSGCLGVILADAVYYKGFCKAQVAPLRRDKNGRIFFKRPLPFLRGPLRALIAKEFRVFFRDQTQWSQLFLIAALFVIYIYNFKVLPLERAPIATIYLQNLMAFLNMGLACFVFAAISARFAFVAVSMEREAFWLLKTAPLSMQTYLWVKFAVYWLPLAVLSQIVIVVTNLLLNATALMMTLSVLTVFCLIPGIVAMGIGLGAAYPDFKSENPTQSATSFGGLVFMILCVSLVGTVIVLEAGPVYRLLMADWKNRPLSSAEIIGAVCAFSVALALCVLAVIWPMRYGCRKLKAHAL